MLIIFDCDGVLVDSEALAAEVFSNLLAELGISLSAQQCYLQFHGHSLRYCFEWLEREKQLVLPADMAERLAHATSQRFSRELKPVAGIVDVLDLLDERHIPYCLASNGGHKKIASSMATTGLNKYFNREQKANCFSIDDVVHGKPAPDLFLFAAESMGVPIPFCTVIEDSPSGIQAAQAAGMKVLVYAPQGDENQHTKVMCFQSMQELKKVF